MPGRAVLVSILSVFTGVAAHADDSYPRGLLPDGVTPTHYALELVIDPRRDGFTGKVAIEVEIAKPTRVIWLHGLGLRDVEARIEAAGATIPATYTEVDTTFGVARLDPGREIAAGPAVLRLSYTGSYREGQEGLFVLEEDGRRYVFSQFQAIDARRVFPGFDQPGFKTPFDITLVAAEGDAVIGNTPIAATRPAGEGLVAHRFERTLPLPTYLLAFAVGPLEVVEAEPVPANELRSHRLPLRGIATRGKGARLEFALASTADFVARLERYFGSPFPYPKLDLIAVPSLGFAMENAGAITYDESMLLVDDDSPPGLLRAFGSAHAHELAHQWFGDLVTPSWWEDIWLNESFATWLGYKIASDWRGDLFDATDTAGDAFGSMDLDSRAAGRPVREPVDDNRHINSTFDDLTYSKGGGVLATFESYLGESTFRNGVRLHLQRHRHATATSDDFFRAMADASGQPEVVAAFRSFVEQPGVPLITARLAPDGSRLALSQSRYRPLGASYDDRRTWVVPVCVSVYGGSAPQRRCTLLGRADGELALPAGTQAVMPNANGVAYYRFAMDRPALARLFAMADELPDREALALADSIGAAFRAGRLGFDALLFSARELAGHPNRWVALALADELTEIGRRWADPAERTAVEAMLAGIYGPRLEALGLDPRAGAHSGDDTNRRLLRRSLAWLLALEAGHGPTAAILADAANRSLEDPAALDQEFRAIARAVGVRESGEPFARAMADLMLTSTDSLVRDEAAAALGSTRDPAVSRLALELTMDPRTRPSEMLAIAFGLLGEPDVRAMAWPWLRENFDRFRERLPVFAQEYAYALPAPFCDAGLRASAAEFLEQADAAVRAGPLPVARTLESIDLCSAQRQALWDDARKALGIAAPCAPHGGGAAGCVVD